MSVFATTSLIVLGLIPAQARPASPIAAAAGVEALGRAVEASAPAAADATAIPAVDQRSMRSYVLLDGQKPVGLCTVHRHEARGVLTLERVYEWPRLGGERVVVRHVETRDTLGWRLSWRELGGAGSSLLAERSPEGRLSWRAWDGSASTRGAFDKASTLFPLEAVELFRAGRGPKGAFELYEPTTRARTMVVAAHRSVEGGRSIEWVRPDGLVAASLRFEGEELTEFTLQAGGLRAALVSTERAAILRARLAPGG